MCTSYYVSIHLIRNDCRMYRFLAWGKCGRYDNDHLILVVVVRIVFWRVRESMTRGLPASHGKRVLSRSPSTDFRWCLPFLTILCYLRRCFPRLLFFCFVLFFGAFCRVAAHNGAVGLQSDNYCAWARAETDLTIVTVLTGRHGIIVREARCAYGVCVCVLTSVGCSHFEVFCYVWYTTI